ncbi:hypothetical protein WJX74_002416 [Apatococcus lobatus]|uniref:Peptidase M14 domain-containing protein n=1 Tax=Apatococcus lobatus TaxID=904363 RepID=A0AAW1SDU1_9CHLO
MITRCRKSGVLRHFLAVVLILLLDGRRAEGADHELNPQQLAVQEHLSSTAALHKSRALHKSLSKDGLHTPMQSTLSKYFSNMELGEYMANYVQRCGNISRLFSLGTTPNGNELWALELSAAPGKIEAKPNFKYLANMHGDEPVGRQLLLTMAEWLCEHRSTDAKAARIIQDMHLFLVPTVNPDGFSSKTRGNSKGVDLNRDFPDPLHRGSLGLAPNGSEQAETVDLIKWMQKRPFVASASFHEGAVVANYPFDGTLNGSTMTNVSGDDPTFQHLASVYAGAHTSMSESKQFPGGITNGAAWYPIWGGMQDWNYLALGCMELTLEISEAKAPPPELLALLWQNNLPAMLALPLAAAFEGLRGFVHAAAPGSSRKLEPGEPEAVGTPLAASIEVEGAARTVKAGPFGDFYRPLPPGEYNVTASMSGYASASALWVVPPSPDSSSLLNFTLQAIPKPFKGRKAAHAEAARAAAEDYMAGQLKDGSVFDTAAMSLRTRHAGQLQPHTWSSVVHRMSVLFLGIGIFVGCRYLYQRTPPQGPVERRRN